MSNWIIPTIQAGVQVVKHKNEIQTLWDKFLNIFAPKTRIVVTGMPGVGKTVLFDYILEKAYGRDYTRPWTSEQAEKGVVKLKGKSLDFVVVPGQQQSPRLDAESLLINKTPPDGIIHLFANGYANVRNEIIQKSLIERGIDNLEKIKAENLQEELEDFKRTCELIKRIYSIHQKPKWIVLVANKVDLYADSLSLREAQNRYTNNSEIITEINNLVNTIGRSNIRWQSFYVCSRLEAFEWNKQRHMLAIVDENQRDEILKNFLNQIINYCSG